MEQIRTIMNYSDAYPWTRTIISSVATAIMLGDSYGINQSALLVAWNANALYDFLSLKYKKYDPNIIQAKQSLIISTGIVNGIASAFSYQVTGLTQHNTLPQSGCVDRLEKYIEKNSSESKRAQRCLSSCYNTWDYYKNYQQLPDNLPQEIFVACSQFCLEKIEPFMCWANCNCCE
jgi:hypothetical protein